MRRAARIDANQPEIVRNLRRLGVSVFITSALGNGFGDIICATRTKSNTIFEIKDGDKPPSQRKLTDAEQDFSDSWPGEYYVIETWEEAAVIMGVM